MQSVSVDEALIDTTAVVYSTSDSQGIGIDEGNVWREQEKADEIAARLKRASKPKPDAMFLLASVATFYRPKSRCEGPNQPGNFSSSQRVSWISWAN